MGMNAPHPFTFNATSAPSCFSQPQLTVNKPKPTCQKPQFSCALNLTFETESEAADIEVKLNKRHTFRLKRDVLTRFSPTALGSLSDNSVTCLAVETPFEEALMQVLMYAVYHDAFVITRYLTTLENAIEVYAAAHALGVTADSELADLILNSQVIQPTGRPLGSFQTESIGGHVWSRRFVDFEFAMKLVNTTSVQHPWSQGIKMLDWLEERNFTTKQEAEELLDSEDFKKVQRYWSLHVQVPFNMANIQQLTHAYPLGSRAISLHCLFGRALNLNC
jgi:hypothetical protein